MYNSQNSIQSKESFTSIVLAQAKLLSVAISPNKLKSPDITQAEQQTNSNISEVPTFYTPTITLPEVTAEMRATLSRLSAEACKRALLSDSIQEILIKADEYGIDYDSGIQYSGKFTELQDKVEQWEDLLAEGIDWCIHWDKSEYDPTALQQEIEEAQHTSYLENSEISSYFNAALGLGV